MKVHYHVFSRGNNQQDIFVTDDARYLFLDSIGQLSGRFDTDIFTYAYNRRHPDWLDKDLILSQIHGENKHQHYCEKSQKYSDENRGIWENIRQGFFYGSQKFVKRIKDRYMVSEPDPAIPQQKSIMKDLDPIAFSSKASNLLQCDLERIKNSPRVSESDKTKRDILLYLLWQQGQHRNIQIGAIMGLTHSAVSRRIAITREKMALEQDFERWAKAIKSQIKP
jgi:hypothetical protein